MNNNSNPVDPSADKSLFEKNVNREWRAPTASEAELIEAWKRKDLRARRPAIYFFGVILLVPITMIVLWLTGVWQSSLALILGIAGSLDGLLTLVLVSDVYRIRQIRRGDYQITDAIALTVLLRPSGKFIVQVKTDSDELLDMTVSENTSKIITPDMPGFLLIYGKNIASRKAKPYVFIPIRESEESAERSADPSPNSDWRLPNASEAEQIAAWTRKIHRDGLPIIIVGLAFLPLLLIAMLILKLSDQANFNDFWMYGLIGSGVEIFLVRLHLAAMKETKQFLSGDYQIMDAVVVSKNSPLGSQRSEYFLQVKTPSGKMINESVGKEFYDAVNENSPGFFVRVNGQKPKKNKGPRINFFPAK